MLDRLEQGVLHEVFGIDVVAGPAGQTPVGPAAQPGQVAGVQRVTRPLVALLRAQQQRE
jgi:hypothetical protein